MYQRVGAMAFKKDLGNTRALCKALGNPEQKLKCIHVAGTNGKGSVSNILAAIFQSAGLKTGLYTSPHLTDFRERIRINGAMIPQEAVVQFVHDNQAHIEIIKPSFFEITVAMAFQHFAQQQVDIAVIEVGLGGRLDSTNVITPIMSVITNISYDHMDMLGNTLELIAAEKAGIIKPDVPVVIGKTQPETAPIFTQIANEKRAPIKFADTSFNASIVNQSPLIIDVVKGKKTLFKGLESHLQGIYQIENILTSICTISQLNNIGYYIDQEHIRHGIKNVSELTGFAGRWQIISHSPITIVDTGHNEAGIKLILSQLATIKHNQLHFVFGMVNDKDSSNILSLLPTNAIYYFCKANIPRGLEVAVLQQHASLFGLNGNTYTSVTEAAQAASLAAQENDLVFIGGSTFVVADYLKK